VTSDAWRQIGLLTVHHSEAGTQASRSAPSESPPAQDSERFATRGATTPYSALGVSLYQRKAHFGTIGS
jgi:hypothetical protein